jgi:TonB family protein
VNFLPRGLRSLLLLASCLTGTVFGQSILITQYGGKNYPVVAAKDMRPYVEIDGKRVLAQGAKFGIKPIEDFLPVFVKVREMKVQTSSIDLVDTGSKINNEFHFRAHFESPYSLEDVFLVLELTMEDGSQSLFLHEIGKLRANKPHLVAVTARSGYPLGSGHFKFRIYSGGLEVLHSEQPFNMRESMLDKLIARRIKDRPDGPPALFFGPTPEYPPKLGKTKTPGQVMMRVRIRPTGAVVDATVVSATEEAMGESALTAIRQFRFLPRIKEGRPVESVAVVPIDFEPVVDASDPR